MIFKIIFSALFLAFLLTRCSGDDIINKPSGDKVIDLNINENDYHTFFISPNNNLDSLKADLTNFRQHLDYNDSFKVDFYLYKDLFIVSLPPDFKIGQAAFLTSWMEYGFCASLNKLDSNKDMFLYQEDSIIKQDFVAGSFRNNSVNFKVNIITSSFEGINKTCYSYKCDLKVLEKQRVVIPPGFNISDTKLKEKGFILKPFEGFTPYIDTIKKSNGSVNV